MRGPQDEKSNFRKGKWSLEEDQKLIAYIQKHGIWNWRQMPKYAGLLRNGKSCRLRWVNYLKPEVRHGNITKEEEELIITMHQLLGNKWSVIAKELPGRTDNEVKNHWHAHLKKRVAEDLVLSTESKETKNTADGEAKPNILLPNSITPLSVTETSESEGFSNMSGGCSSSSSTSSANGGTGDINANICSSETVDDLQDFWAEQCPLEDHGLAPIPEEWWYQEPPSPYGFDSNANFWFNLFMHADGGGIQEPNLYF